MTGISTSAPLRPALRATLPAVAGLAALALLVGGLGLWSTQTRLAGAVVSSGVIEVTSNRQVVQHPEGGVVGEILARDGDHVAAGQTLLRFDGTLLASELAIVEGQLFELLARKARLKAERDGAADLAVPADLAAAIGDEVAVAALVADQRQLFLARRETLDKQVEGLGEQAAQARSQIAGTEAQLTALRRQLVLVGEELADQQSLFDRGLTQASRVKATQREEARLTGDIGRLEAEIARIGGGIAGISIETLRLGAAHREEASAELRDLQFREIELAERRLSLKERLSRLEVRAPVAGTVYGSQVFALKSVIQAAAPMMYVVPQDAPLLVAARVDALHIDQVHAGQAATLRFPAFNQRQTPELAGHVVNLSADAFTDERTGFSFYRAEILPDEGELDRLGGQALVPGMPVETFIRTEDRTPLSYLTKPFTDYFAKAFKD
ncbi:HlyD family type I secretion periplasmic adaptor subunit [Defluviimonas salinarum]|uniref:Membrane fusion protein (MFP) family protein n=1 Tax=Defluviimonas salinarum TaxID=2992147 RepID=A0ABT3J938_9RHOB|nr:HlyD family type I secretion periplasmic adaptor subunit [Defluviimonas salinarum]MCW3784198.1 HlyD family type I secretion periplasmic adaptor subunit [Defluviimonas salinarum]